MPSRRELLQAAGTTLLGGVGTARQSKTEAKLVITYDDSVREDYTKAFPIHRDEGVPASIAAVSNYVAWDADSDDERLTGAQVRELHDSGWEIMSHTVSHEHLGTQQLTKPASPGDTRLYVDYNYHGRENEAAVVLDDGQNTARVSVSHAAEDEDGPYLALDGELETSFPVGTTERFTEERIRQAMADSKAVIGDHGVPDPSHIVYPYGRHCEKSQEVVADSYDSVVNYRLTGMNAPGDANPYRFGRRPFEQQLISGTYLTTLLEDAAEKDALYIVGGHTKNMAPERIRTVIREAKRLNFDIVTMTEGMEYAVENPGAPTTTTQQPTTEQPTTAQPTTRQPTTEQPTTAQPTTRQPTTERPTTAPPTTEPTPSERPTTAQSATPSTMATERTTARPSMDANSADSSNARAASSHPLHGDIPAATAEYVVDRYPAVSVLASLAGVAGVARRYKE
ncbi:polysaccharide deacetylase family protein [Haloarchaeobius sp. DFWS5]|uniref:polysaccharide deacetylase family protein n=1 Tax=Haloarchaeobius sp. DFWS5 TaxID=3446114 RepID=UPI003EBB1CBD